MTTTVNGVSVILPRPIEQIDMKMVEQYIEQRFNKPIAVFEQDGRHVVNFATPEQQLIAMQEHRETHITTNKIHGRQMTLLLMGNINTLTTQDIQCAEDLWTEPVHVAFHREEQWIDD